ncbi:hypothetical protein AWENTII_007854 [Aspergillus wentii]
MSHSLLNPPPWELILFIISNLALKKTVSRLRTCHSLYDSYIPVLYRHKPDKAARRALKWAMKRRKPATARRAILNGKADPNVHYRYHGKYPRSTFRAMDMDTESDMEVVELDESKGACPPLAGGS